MKDPASWCLKCELEGLEPYGDYDCAIHGITIPDAAMRQAITDLRDSKVPDSHPYKKRLNG